MDFIDCLVFVHSIDERCCDGRNDDGCPNILFASAADTAMQMSATSSFLDAIMVNLDLFLQRLRICIYR